MCGHAGAAATHSLVPPTPGPLAAGETLGVDVGVVMGVGMGAYTITLPQIAPDDLGQGPFMTALLFAFMSIGMVTTTPFLASRREVRRKGVLFLIAFQLFGPGLMVIGLSDHYFFTAGVMVVWGVGGGLLMTSQRTLLQQHTPPELMGRMMALVALSITGMIIPARSER